MYIKRIAEENIKKIFNKEKKVMILYGPRQAGKTTLIKVLTESIKNQTIFFNGDDIYAQKIFSNNELNALKPIIGNKKILVIDEAQRIQNIGLTLKLIIDNLPTTILVSGSASFDLANKINEPLTGRSQTFWLYPFSFSELKEKYAATATETALEEMLRFGMFPKIHTSTADEEKQDYLYEYTNNYLFKDILMFETVRKPKKILDLLTLLALQIGNEVSVAELAQNLSLSQPTVANYLDLLEKMFVLYNVRGFSRNLRKEISKTSKYYFYDVGLRNAIIRNFNPLQVRSDAGVLFENWFIMEKIKKAHNTKQYANFYFWRTYDQQEIDLIEEYGGKLFGWECKFSEKKIPSAPGDWQKNYPHAMFTAVNGQNFLKWL
ncbi:MAG: ATP-binding protein [Candidatus Magasanikbacteria bacterium]|nr:ATP-binding protein [Candidatus Magasanikbacteria bacterium]